MLDATGEPFAVAQRSLDRMAELARNIMHMVRQQSPRRGFGHRRKRRLKKLLGIRADVQHVERMRENYDAFNSRFRCEIHGALNYGW